MKNPDDDKLFAEEMQDVQPLKTEPRVQPVDGAGGPSLAQILRRQAATEDGSDPNPLTLGEVPPVAPFDEIAWKNPGIQEGVYRKLRLGRYRIEASLDLHRMTVAEAREALWRFLGDCIGLGMRCVLVSHGRGDRSATPGRLKSYTRCWLEASDDVLAFHSAQRQHGGYGSVYVLLRKNAEARKDNREQFARRRR